ncbi:MAG: hypothetical protein AAFO15_00590 [Pseudomonadota bacterium]
MLFISDKMNVFNGQTAQILLIKDIDLSKSRIENQLKIFQPKQFVRCKYSVYNNRITFIGCINYGVENYLLQVNRLKLFEYLCDNKKCDISDFANKLNTNNFTQELQRKLNIKQFTQDGFKGFGTYHQVIFLSRSICDPLIHHISLNGLLGRRFRRYVQFYGIVNNKEYIRTSYSIIKTKYSNVTLDTQEFDFERLIPYIKFVNGSVSALRGEPILELNNFLNLSVQE